MLSQLLNMTAPPEVYQQRRARLAAAVQRPLVLLAGQARARQYATNTHPFRAGSSYLYFGGPPVPGAALVVEPNSNGAQGCALVRPVLGFEDAVWTGEAPDDSRLAAAVGVRESTLIGPEVLAKQLAGRSAGFVGPPCPPSLEWASSLGLQPATPDELQPIIDMRLIKDEHELKAMWRAAKVTIKAHMAAMKAATPGRTEADVAAALLGVLTANNCIPSFSPIVTVRADVLHSEVYVNALDVGKLLVADAGAEEPGGYASDVTRTYPVGGNLTSMQRQLYDTVLRAEREAIAACTPGRRYRDIHDLAALVLCEGLVEAGLLRGDPAELAARAAHTLFFTHGLGHLIGLDVHDMEDFGDQAGYAPGRSRRPEFGNKYLRLDRDLEAGMTVTIEPGLYIVPAVWQRDDLVAPFADVVNRPAVESLIEQFFGGMRIEDTIHVRTTAEGGPEVLTCDLPTDADTFAKKVSG